MSAGTYEFKIELRSGPGGEVLAAAPVHPAFLQPSLEETIWQAQRRGIVGADRSRVWSRIEPVFEGEGSRVRSLRVEVGEDGSARPALARDFSLKAFGAPAAELIARLEKERVLPADVELEVAVTARAAAPAGAPRVRGVLRQTPLPLVSGRLEEWELAGTVLNPEAGRPEDTPVFIRRQTLNEALASCRRGGDRESGAFLVGRLLRQEEPRHEIFVVIEAALEARHAREDMLSLALTTETYLDFQERLTRRRESLGRPEELLVAISHGHSFLPSLDSEGRPRCPSCPLRATCSLHSAFYSPADKRVHLALLPRSPFGVGLVWGWTPRQEDVLRVYGLRDGAIEERSISVVE